MLLKLEETFDKIKVGTRVRCNSKGDYGTVPPYTGAVIAVKDRRIHIRRDDGTMGTGEACSWYVSRSAVGDGLILEILNEPKTGMSNIVTFFKNLTLNADEKLLIEMGLEDPTGVRTKEYESLANEMFYKESRPKIIEIAKQMKAEEDAKKKKA